MLQGFFRFGDDYCCHAPSLNAPSPFPPLFCCLMHSTHAAGRAASPPLSISLLLAHPRHNSKFNSRRRRVVGAAVVVVVVVSSQRYAGSLNFFCKCFPFASASFYTSPLLVCVCFLFIVVVVVAVYLARFIVAVFGLRLSGVASPGVF